MMPRPPSQQMFQLLDYIEHQPATMAEISQAINAPIKSLAMMIDRLKYQGAVHVVDRVRVENCKRPVAVYGIRD